MKRSWEDEDDDQELSGAPAAKRVRFGATNIEIEPHDESKNNDNPSNNRIIHIVLDAYGHSDKGKKGSMEDKLLIEPDLARITRYPYFSRKSNGMPTKFALFSVFDGHGGASIATNLQMNLKDLIISKIVQYNSESNNNNLNSNNMATKPPINQENTDPIDEYAAKIVNIQKALHASFKLMDDRVEYSATGTVVYVEDDTVFTANIGDSKAVLARMAPIANTETTNEINNKNKDNSSLSSKKRNDITSEFLANMQSKHEMVYPKALQLTQDDTVLQLSESKRITNSGGTISQGRVNGILEVTRSFGDSRLKKCGVISAPHISKFNINKERDLFMIIACDGLWSVFNPSDAVKFVYEKFKSKTQPNVKQVVRELLAEAILNKQAKDNVSAIIVRFNKY